MASEKLSGLPKNTQLVSDRARQPGSQKFASYVKPKDKRILKITVKQASEFSIGHNE